MANKKDVIDGDTGKALAVFGASKPATKPKEELPEHLRAQQGQRQGLEDMDQGDITIPRLMLCQDLTPQRKKANANFIEGLEVGDLFNSVTGEIYGRSVLLIPLFFFKSRIYFEDINRGGGILCQSLNAKNGGRLHPESCETCIFSSWDDPEGSKDGKPRCGLFFNYACLMEDGSLIALSFKSTGLKQAKQFNSMIRLTNLPMYAKFYQFDSVDMQKNNNTFASLKITPRSYTPKEFFDKAEETFKALHEKNINLDTAGMDGDEHGDTGFDTQNGEM
jgi:hypothetical protein